MLLCSIGIPWLIEFYLTFHQLWEDFGSILCYWEWCSQNPGPKTKQLMLQQDWSYKKALKSRLNYKSMHWESNWAVLICAKVRKFLKEIVVSLLFSIKNNGILLPKLFWPTVRKNCSSDREQLLKFEAEGRDFAKILRSLEQFVRTVKRQNNFW